MSGFWSVPEGCSDSVDDNKRDQLRRLTLSVDKLNEGSPEPEISEDLLLDPFQDSEPPNTAPSSRDALILCEDDPPDEYTQLLSRSEQLDTDIPGDRSTGTALASEHLTTRGDHLTTPRDPLLQRGDKLFSHGAPLLSHDAGRGSDDLVDLLPVKDV